MMNRQRKCDRGIIEREKEQMREGSHRWLHPSNSFQGGWQWDEQTGRHPKSQMPPCIRHTQGPWLGVHRLHPHKIFHGQGHWLIQLPLAHTFFIGSVPSLQILACLNNSTKAKSWCTLRAWLKMVYTSYSVSAAGKQASTATPVLCRWPRCWNYT